MALGFQHGQRDAAEESFSLTVSTTGDIKGRPWATSGSEPDDTFVMRGHVTMGTGSPRPVSDGSGGTVPRQTVRIDLVQTYHDGVKTHWTAELDENGEMKRGKWTGGLVGTFEAAKHLGAGPQPREQRRGCLSTRS